MFCRDFKELIDLIWSTTFDAAMSTVTQMKRISFTEKGGKSVGPFRSVSPAQFYTAHDVQGLSLVNPPVGQSSTPRTDLIPSLSDSPTIKPSKSVVTICRVCGP